MNMDEYFMWIPYERLHNHNKAKHNKTVCIFLGIYCNPGGHKTLLEYASYPVMAWFLFLSFDDVDPLLSSHDVAILYIAHI